MMKGRRIRKKGVWKRVECGKKKKDWKRKDNWKERSMERNYNRKEREWKGMSVKGIMLE